MNILIKLTCLIGLVVAPILGHEKDCGCEDKTPDSAREIKIENRTNQAKVKILKDEDFTK